MAVDVSEPMTMLRDAHRPENADALRLGDQVRHFLQRVSTGTAAVRARQTPW